MADEHARNLRPKVCTGEPQDASMHSAEPGAAFEEDFVRVLAIGAHPDDIELGCGGSLAAHRLLGDAIALLVLTTGEQGPQAAASRVDEQDQAATKLAAALIWGSFDDGAVPEGRATIDLIQRVMNDFAPDVIYTHAVNDTHQDHRATALATSAAARRACRILRYESPTTTVFTPNVFVDIEHLLDQKVELICAHVSQVLKNGLVDVDAVKAQARYYGFKARVHLAEGFETDRFVWGMGTERDGEDRLELDIRRPEAFDVVALR
jgi:LmbE family N-acetylglucosaminyl deacetylase